MSHPQADISRHSLMKLLLKWEGRLTNRRLRQLFDLSSTRASEWIRELNVTIEEGTDWDSRNRSYESNKTFYAKECGSTIDSETSLDQYIALVGLPLATTINNSLSMCTAFPLFETPQPEIFGLLSRAIDSSTSVKIIYCSMSNPEPHQRIIRPHTLIRTDRRWHVRAFCDDNNEFRDYNLGRIIEVQSLTTKVDNLIKNDIAWNTLVPIHVIAHPALSIEQKKVVNREYFSGTAGRTESCRGALVNYVINALNAATNTEIQLPPEFLLAISNLEDIKPWLFK